MAMAKIEMEYHSLLWKIRVV